VFTEIASELSPAMSAIFDVIPLGTLVWEVADPDDPKALRLVYANKTADEFVGGPLRSLVGLFVEEAFPGFVETGLPAAYLEAFRSGEDRHLGEVSYGSQHVKHACYSVKVSPLSQFNCVAVFFEDITKSKEAQTQLIKSEKKYRTLVELMREGIWVVDEAAKTTFVNPYMASMIEYAQQDIIGKPVYEFLSDESRQTFFLAAERRKQGVSEVYHLEFIKKSGGKIYTVVNAVPMIDENKNFIGGIGCISDVTSQRAAELKLRESEKKYRDLVEMVQEGILLVNIEGVIIFANPHMAKLLGCSVEELENASVFDFLDSQNAEFCQTGLERRQRGLTDNYRLEFISKTGRRIYTEVRATPILNDSRKYSASLACIVDVTAQRAAELKLRESEQKYRSLVEMVQEGIWTIDENAYTTFTNPHMAKMLGYTVEEMQGKHLYEFMDEDGVRICERNLERRKQGIEEQHSFEFITKDGRRVYAELETVPLYDDQGKYTGAFACVMDATEKHVAERKLREQQVALAHVSRLTALGEMATALAHEINQPLTSVSGYVQGCIERIRQNRLSPDELNDILTKISSQVGRTGAVIQRILDFVKKTPPEREVIEVRKLITEALGFFDPQLKMSRVQVSLAIEKNLKKVCVDRVQLQQVILNILSNAIDSLANVSSERNRIVISASQKEGSVLLSIRDFGKGMKRSLLTKVFKPFYSTKSNGTGMGLAICHSIVEAHGGRMFIDRNFREGVSVNIVLPVEDGEKHE